MTLEDVREDEEADNFSYNIIFPFNTYRNYGEKIMMLLLRLKIHYVGIRIATN